MPLDIEVEVGRRIERLRNGKGLTREELAQITGMNKGNIYRLETGQQSMTLKTLTIISAALGVRITRLLRGF